MLYWWQRKAGSYFKGSLLPMANFSAATEVHVLLTEGSLIYPQQKGRKRRLP